MDATSEEYCKSKEKRNLLSGRSVSACSRTALRTWNVDAEALCRASNIEKTKKRLQQVAKALSRYAHRLNGRAAEKRVEETLRQSLLDDAAPIQQDARTLRVPWAVRATHLEIPSGTAADRGRRPA